MRAVTYLHGERESLWELGKKIGLTGEALHFFSYALTEVKIEITVTPEGKATIIAVDDRPLSKKRRRSTTGERGRTARPE